LFVASKYGLCDVVKYLLISGADINPRLLRKLISAPELSKHLTTSYSPFCDATNNGDCPSSSRKLISAPELSKYLTINLRNKRGQSALFVASEEGQCDVVKCLLSSGADINLNNEDGQSPLFVASSVGYYNIVIHQN
jgi:ankyrin repeat protein